MNKIELCIGNIKISYEGDKEYIRDDLPNLLDKLLEIGKQVAAPSSEAIDAPVQAGVTLNKKISLGTTNAIAKKLDVKSGADLFFAAAAKLHFVDHKETFPRKDLLTEIRAATQFYKASYTSNASNILSSLSNDKLNETAKDIFALTSNAVNDLELKFSA